MRALLAGGLAAVVLGLARPSGGRVRLARLRSATRPRGQPVPGPVVLELVAAVLAAGVPVVTALRLVAASLDAHGASGSEHLGGLALRHELALVVPSASPGPAWAQLLDRTLLLARDAGVAPAGLLVAAAADERRRRAARQRIAAARLGVRVVLPTGLCLLPAFVLLTVVPLVLALLAGEG